jgi:membrane-bound lytic murein transglycosylase A
MWFARFVIFAMALASPPASLLAAPPVPEGVRVEAVAFADLQGWARDDHAAAWHVFLASCRSVTDEAPAQRQGLTPPQALVDRCREALALGEAAAPRAKNFFESRFEAWRIHGPDGHAFFTGYYEPEVEGSLAHEGRYQSPLYGRPDDLVSFEPGQSPPGLETYAAARRLPDGSLVPYPDRKAIEEGTLDGQGLERVWLADPVDRFFMQVQGSGRVRLPDGSVVRLSYAGRNGHPYTGIGRVVADWTNTPRSEMTMAKLRGLLARDASWARDVMHENKSFVFFKFANLDPHLGPIGGQGLPLTPLRSIAVDRTLWPYGLPVFIDTAIPDVPGVHKGLVRRLAIAQDTGSAILGAARADIFFGSGDEAGVVAGAVRHRGSFTVLWPKATP